MSLPQKIKDEILGLSDAHLVKLPQHEFLMAHRDILLDWEKFTSIAASENIELKAVSAHRSFQQQMTIWSKKAQGERVLLNDEGEPLDYHALSSEEILWSILRWSALPGFSRHHWGSDLDLIDQNALDQREGYCIELVPSEYGDQGIFSKLGDWANRNTEELFFRPYSVDQGGVAPEPWHFSHLKIASTYLDKMNIEFFQSMLESELYRELPLIDLVQKNAKTIYQQYIVNIQAPLSP